MSKMKIIISDANRLQQDVSYRFVSCATKFSIKHFRVVFLLLMKESDTNVAFSMRGRGKNCI
jgi:hypothetical protein